jgi:hypothetical protein
MSKSPWSKLFIDDIIHEFSKNFILSHAFDSTPVELGVFKDVFAVYLSYGLVPVCRG